MRRIVLLVVVAALAMGSAEAASGAVPVVLRTPGAEFVELVGGNGRAVVARRGSIFITIRSGRLRVVDLPAAGRPNLNPPCARRARRVSPTTVEIVGRNIGCRVWSGEQGGPWQVVMRGSGVNASGTVRGSVTLDAANRGATGRYRIAGGSWQRWPRQTRTFELDRKLSR